MRALDRLRALESADKAPDHELTKLTKGGFGGFGSAEEAPCADIFAARADAQPTYRWLIVREVCCLPEMTRSELAACYPGARLVPLPDSAAEALTKLTEVEKDVMRARRSEWT